MVGLPIAIALGALIGKSSYRLEVLHDCTPEAVERGRQFIAEGRINITLDKEACDKLYVDVVCKKGNRRAEAIIAREHTRLVYLCCDNNLMLDERSALHGASEGDSHTDLTLRQVFDFATTTPLEELEFINEADYDRFDQTDDIALENVRRLIENGETIIPVTNLTKGFTAEMKLELTNRQRGMILAGGLINMIAQQNR
jgi:L-cysteine desulfidase